MRLHYLVAEEAAAAPRPGARTQPSPYSCRSAIPSRSPLASKPPAPRSSVRFKRAATPNVPSTAAPTSSLRKARKPAVTASAAPHSPFVPEVADLIAATSPATLLCAAGGIADGRGLAAALMLGADGVVVGSRFGRRLRRTSQPANARGGAGCCRRRHHPLPA